MKSIESFRERLEALLREADEAGFELWNSMEVEENSRGFFEVDTDYYFLNRETADVSEVDASLIWEEVV